MPEPSNPAEARAEAEAHLRQLRALGETNEAFQLEYSKQLYSRFQVLQVAGFSKGEAFLIVQHRGLT